MNVSEARRASPAPPTAVPDITALPPHLARRALLVALVASVSAPALYALGRGILDFSLPWWSHLWATVLPGYLWNSLATGLVAVACAVVLGGMPAWLTVRYRFVGRQWGIFTQLLPLTIPAYVAAGLFQEAWRSPFFESRMALSVEIGAAAAPLVFLYLRVALARLPASLFEVSASLGCGPLQRLGRIALPLLGAPLAAAACLVAAEALGEFGAASRVGIATLSVGLHQQWHGLQRPELAHMLALLLFVVAALLATPLIRAGLRYQRENSAAEQRLLQARPLGPGWTVLAHAACLLAVVPGFVAPVGLALHWALARRAPADALMLARDGGTTLAVALACAGACLALTVAFALLFRADRRGRTADRGVWLVALNYLTPSSVLALAWLGGALSGVAVIVAATTLKLLPLMLLPVADAMSRLPSAQTESARALGCSPLQAVWRTVLPQLAPVLAGGALLVFVLAATELTLSLALQPFGYSSLSLRVFAYAGLHMTQLSSFWILSLVLLCIYPIWRLATLMAPSEARHA
ncbi:MAG: iron ABC transporter permease [Rhodocyclaceae bacterium]|nr:iron ABC transporter permease [Rhodocyclaceae bacterium]